MNAFEPTAIAVVVSHPEPLIAAGLASTELAVRTSERHRASQGQGKVDGRPGQPHRRSYEIWLGVAHTTPAQAAMT